MVLRSCVHIATYWQDQQGMWWHGDMVTQWHEQHGDMISWIIVDFGTHWCVNMSKQLQLVPWCSGWHNAWWHGTWWHGEMSSWWCHGMMAACFLDPGIWTHLWWLATCNTMPQCHPVGMPPHANMKHPPCQYVHMWMHHHGTKWPCHHVTMTLYHHMAMSTHEILIVLPCIYYTCQSATMCLCGNAIM